MNRRKDLHKLFHEYLERKNGNKPSSASSGGNHSGYEYNSIGTIYFYEWSDLYRPPTRYYSLGLFERFLSECGIPFRLYERDMIISLGVSYISCKRNSKELVIRGSYDLLHEAMSNDNILLPCVHNDSSDSLGKLPYAVACTHPPRIINEEKFTENHWFG